MFVWAVVVVVEDNKDVTEDGLDFQGS